jgi:molecular chaperone GrpE (heat shock protein)
MYQNERKMLGHSCFAAFGRDQSGRLRSVQLTKLAEDGKRALTFEREKLNKIQYGIAKGSFVCLQEDTTHDRVFIAEGIETALSLKEAGLKGRIIASLGIHNISNYQGHEKEIILCGDNDAHKKSLSSGLTRGSQTHRILEQTQESLNAQGKSVSIIKPIHPGDDFNDVLKKNGVQGIRDYLKDYLDPEKQQVSQKTAPQAMNRETPSSSATSHYSTEKTNSIGLISDYIQSKLRDIRVYEGTSLAHEAKHELKDYITTLQKNEPLFQELKDQNKDLTKDLERLFREQERVKDRSMGMEM